MTSRSRAAQESNGDRKSKRQRRSLELTDQQGLGAQSMEIETNGNRMNTNAEESDFIGPNSMINREEYLRLVQQSLSALGYEDVANQLEQRSGVRCQKPLTADIRQCVLEGDWDGAIKYVDSILDVFSEPGAAKAVKFLIFEQKFLELLDSGDTLGALKCLRTEIAPLEYSDKDRVHALSRKLLVQQPTSGSGGGAAVNGTSNNGKHTSSASARSAVLKELQASFPVGFLLPEGRLEELLEQALASQIGHCHLHNTLHPQLSLLQDYTAGKEQLPLWTSQTLEAHTSEVWHLQFSHDGKMLATCGRDCKVIIWDVVESQGSTKVQLRRILSGHTEPVLFLAWSPDDSILASCAQDCHVRLWAPTAPTAAGACIGVLQHHRETVLSAAWLPDNQTLITAGQDRLAAVVGIDGEVHQIWRSYRLQDVVVADGAAYFLASTHERRIIVFSAMQIPKSVADAGQVPHTEGLMGGEWLFDARHDPTTERDLAILEGEDLMAFSLSPCGRYLLANLRDGGLSLWDLGSDRKVRLSRKPTLVCRFAPPDNPEGNLGRFVVRSCMGGVGTKFVTTGTETGKVSIWHRDTGELIEVLDGHQGTVNAVSWNPARPDMMATASDDGTVKIWMTKEESRKVKERVVEEYAVEPDADMMC